MTPVHVQMQGHSNVLAYICNGYHSDCVNLDQYLTLDHISLWVHMNSFCYPHKGITGGNSNTLYYGFGLFVDLPIFLCHFRKQMTPTRSQGPYGQLCRRIRFRKTFFDFEENLWCVEKTMFLACKSGPGTQGPGTILSSKIVRMKNVTNAQRKSVQEE